MNNTPQKTGPLSCLQWLLIFVGISILFTMVCTLCGILIYLQYGDSDLFNQNPFAATPTEVALEQIPTFAITAQPIYTATPSPLPPATELPSPVPTATAEPTLPPTPIFVTADLPSQLDQQPRTEQAQQALLALLSEPYPAHDYYTSQLRFSRDKPFDRTFPAVTYALGYSRTIMVEEVEITLNLSAVSTNAYFWSDQSLPYNETLFAPITERFETTIYPKLVDLFGQEWRPGVDGDNHINIIHLSEITSGDELGYFDSSDVYPQEVFAWSNEMDAIYLNMAELSLGEDYYYATLAHEVQHLIHWAQDPNETSWVDEGFGQLAEHVLGYDTFIIDDYTDTPDFQFNSWSSEDALIYQHYSAGALFAIYFWEQLGDAAVRDLAQSDLDGLAAVNAILATYRPDLTLDQFLSDWYVANYSNNQLPSPAHTYNFSFPNVRPSTLIREFPFQETTELNQMGARYIRIAEAGSYTVSFAGDGRVDMVPTPPKNAEKVWLVPALDGIAATLQRTVDLTSLSEATLTFDTWYDLEDEYDLAYVTVSADNGQSWQVLRPNNATSGAYGPGINGRSQAADNNENGWVQQTIPLDRFAGQEILISIELYSDGVISEGNFAIANLRIPELEVEPAAERWTGNGFVYVAPYLPQNWSVQLIIHGENGRVESLIPDPYNQLTHTYTAPSDSTLVIAPITPFTQDNAFYWLQITTP